MSQRIKTGKPNMKIRKSHQVSSTGKSIGQGMNWIRQDKRLAIYLRDGLACAYCGATVEQGVKLTLDHIVPHSKGGSHHEYNLVTCCFSCNSSRSDKPLRKWATRKAINHVVRCSTRPLNAYRFRAKEMIALRGSALKVLDAIGGASR